MTLGTEKRSRASSFAASLVLATITVLLPNQSEALNFHPTETEWLIWPDYCRVRYVDSGAGRNSQYSRRISPDEVERYRRELGNDVWHWLHHYCSGLVYLSRAKVEDNTMKRNWLFNEAKGQMMGQFRRVPRDNPFFGVVATSIGSVYWERGNIEQALSFTRESMMAQPGYSSAYTLASLIFRKEGNMQKAREVLLAGNEACNGDSAEIHYFLGLLLLEEGEIDEAVLHARYAYDLGYPLPGLMAKLERLGKKLY